MYEVNIGHAMQIHGWMEPMELMWLGIQASRCNRICEIGSWKGRSTRALVDNALGTVLAVDTWAGSGGEDDLAKVDDPEKLFQEFLTNMAGVPEGKLTILKDTSLNAAKWCAENNTLFDMIFIDADHSYESVKADILAWFPLLSEGGIICGHDYIYSWPGVVKAVNEIFPDHVMCADTIWRAVKIKAQKEEKV